MPPTEELTLRTELFTRGLARLWRNFPATSDVGLAHLIDAAEFYPALGTLYEDLLRLRPINSGPLIDLTSTTTAPEGADLALDRCFPDGIELSRGIDSPRSDRLRDRLIVIVGCGRSGTTWLHDLLLAHPDVVGAHQHESWLFEQLEPLWRNEFIANCDPAEAAGAVREFCDTVLLGKRDDGSGPISRFAVEKTPVHAYLLPRIATVYPDAYVIHLIRDGRDVARSISQTPFFNIPDPGNAAAFWTQLVRKVRADQDQVPRFKKVNYESMLADVERQLRDVISWVGLATDDAALTPVLAEVGTRVSTHAGTAVPIGHAGWKDLPKPERKAIYANAGSELVTEGYASKTQVRRGRLLG